jgi:hypothetical protein
MAKFKSPLITSSAQGAWVAGKGTPPSSVIHASCFLVFTFIGLTPLFCSQFKMEYP